jgi:hypothetical protein
MTTDKLLNTTYDPRWLAVGMAGVITLTILAFLLRKLARNDLAGLVTGLATLLGLAWSAQGMWDTAVHHYKQDVLVASVLFVVFESMMLARMLKARQYRTDLKRRAKHVRAVWLIAVVMALVVALGEGWAQAPARLAIPLLVAYGWHTDLTAADDPDIKLETSWRWTPRRIGLALGLLEPGARDAVTVDRDNLRDRMTRLAFRIHHAPAWLNDALRRPTRLARLKTIADDTDLTAVRTRLARMSVDLMDPPKPERKSELIVPPARRIELPSDRRVQGEHVTPEGATLRRDDLRQDAILRMRASMTPDRPKGMTAQELAALYSPPLGTRTAEQVAADARKLNGSALR